MSLTLAPTQPTAISSELLATVADNAAAVDAGKIPARYALELLAAEGSLELGLAGNADGQLLEQVRVIRALAERDLSVAFSAWAHRMTAEYLSAAATPTPLLRSYAQDLRAGTHPGVTGMASVMKTVAGCGHLDLEARQVEGGFVVSGTIAWASNLAADSIIVTGATVPGKDPGAIIFAVRADQEGVSLAKPFELLGLNATASAGVGFADVFIPDSAVIDTDLGSFAARIRPTFALLQISECLGVAQAAITAAAGRLQGVQEVFSEQQQQLARHIDNLINDQEALACRVGGEGVDVAKLLRLRLDAAQAATAAAAVEVRVAGGAGYAKSSPASRRFREAAFIPVQSPSEAQLRWELARAEGKEV